MDSAALICAKIPAMDGCSMCSSSEKHGRNEWNVETHIDCKYNQ